MTEIRSKQSIPTHSHTHTHTHAPTLFWCDLSATCCHEFYVAHLQNSRQELKHISDLLLSELQHLQSLLQTQRERKKREGEKERERGGGTKGKKEDKRWGRQMNPDIEEQNEEEYTQHIGKRKKR